jgi:hypothetical protein
MNAVKETEMFVQRLQKEQKKRENDFFTGSLFQKDNTRCRKVEVK